jgi:hypothetical protein
MKRISFGLLLLFAVGILACGPQSTTNNATPIVNASPTSSPVVGNNNIPTKSDDPINYGEVLVTIIIADDDKGKPYIASVLPDPADLSGGMRVQWLVDNQSKAAAGENVTVEIGSFTGKANPRDTRPFGPDACANSFTLNFLKEGKQSREISEQADFQAGELAYSYEVTLKAEDGSELFKFKRRPEIIVGGVTVKPGASPIATPRPPPPAKSKTYGLFLRR